MTVFNDVSASVLLDRIRRGSRRAAAARPQASEAASPAPRTPDEP